MNKIATFKKTQDQLEATSLLVSPAKHILLFGGSRSGKTFLLVYALFLRAFKEKSRHTILRHRFAHAKQSLVYDTIPDVFSICFPNAGSADSYLNKSDWFYKLPNGSEVWIGGLDDKERTEKILGNEYSTIYFNECSQMPYSSILKARTRLAEKNGLNNKFYYDNNPPSKAHWSYKEFVKHNNPDSGEPLPREQFASMLMNPEGNKQNLDKDYIGILASMPENERNRFLLGLWGEAISGAVYGKEMQLMHEEDRIIKVPYDEDNPVYTYWDLGFNDTTAIWFMQQVGREIRVIDYHEENGQPISHYAKMIKEKPYIYEKHCLPHDAVKTELSTGTNVREQLSKLIGRVDVLPRTNSIISDIYATKAFMRKVVIDEYKCRKGVEALESYRREFDELNQVYKEKPVHDWSSNGSDAFRYMAVHYNMRQSEDIMRRTNNFNRPSIFD
jgi:PBSX family phage terminase large subunit